MVVGNEQEPLLGRQSPDLPDSKGQNVSETEYVSEESKVDKVILMVMILGAFLSMACESFVASTHEEIASYFNDLSLGPWLLTAYAMGYSMMLPLYGNLTDVYGAKNMMLFAYAVFSIGCIITGIAVSMPMAIVGRLITSTGGAGMVDLVSILLNRMTTVSQVATLRVYLILGITLGVSCGSPLGGILTDTIGWRWSFLVQVPIAFFSATIMAIRLPSDSPDEEFESQSSWLKKLSQIDVWGYLFLVIALGCSLFVLHFIGEPDSQNRSIMVSLSILMALSGALFVWVELKTKKNPIVPLRMLAKNGIGLLCAQQLPLSFCRFALVSNATSFLIHTKNASNSIAAVPIIGYALGAMIGTVSSGYFVKKVKKCNMLCHISAFIVMLGCTFMIIRWRHDIPYWELIYVLPAGIGVGALFSLNFLALSIRASKEASIITTYYVCQQIGAITGTACSTGLLRLVFHDRLVKHLGESSSAQRIIAGVLRNNRFQSLLPGPTQAQVVSAFLESFQVIPILCLCTSAAVIPTLLGLKDLSIE